MKRLMTFIAALIAVIAGLSTPAFGGLSESFFEVDPTSGRRRVTGGLVDLGGLGLSGTVRLTGEPGRGVRISLPHHVRLVAPDGATAEVSDIVTDLPAMPRLGPTIASKLASTPSISRATTPRRRSARR